jgi:hypothetical protein
MRLTSLTAVLLAALLPACFFAPIDGYVVDPNPTYPDGGRIPIDAGSGPVNGNNNNQTGVLASATVSGTVSQGSTYAAGTALSATVVAADARGQSIAANLTYQWSLSSGGAIFLTAQNGASCEIQAQTVESDTQVTLSVVVTQNGTVSTTGSITFIVSGQNASQQLFVSTQSQLCANSNSAALNVGADLTLFSSVLMTTGCFEASNVAWTTSNSGVATVNPVLGTSTIIHGVAAGTVNITGTLNNLSVTVPITVSTPTGSPNQHIVRVPSSAPQCSDIASEQVTGSMGASWFVAAVIGDTASCNYATGYFFNWSSDNDTIATVTPTMQGSNTATIRIGTATSGKTNIHATASGDGGTFVAQFEVIIG